MALPTTSSYHQANAVNQAVIDGQQGCTTGGDSGDKKVKMIQILIRIQAENRAEMLKILQKNKRKISKRLTIF